MLKKIRPRVPWGLPIAGVILLVVGLIAGPIIAERVPEEELARNVLLAALPFIFVFLSIIIFYITIIWAVASVLNNEVPRPIYQMIERIIIAGIVLGVVGLFQPWSFFVYRYSFQVLLIATLLFILWSHIIPKGQHRMQHLTATSIAEYEQEAADGA